MNKRQTLAQVRHYVSAIKLRTLLSGQLPDITVVLQDDFLLKITVTEDKKISVAVFHPSPKLIHTHIYEVEDLGIVRSGPAQASMMDRCILE